MSDVEIREYRGVKNLVAAELIVDSEAEISWGTPFAVAGVANIEKSTESSSDPHYYDNKAAVVINSVGADTINIQASALPLSVLAKLTGQIYDSTKGALYEGEPRQKYFALGYIAGLTAGSGGSAGSEVYVWRLKGTFAIPDQTNATKDAGTDANGQTLVYTGLETNHAFSACTDEYGIAHGAKSTVIDLSENKADVSAFFSAVTTPDTIVGKTAYKLTKTQAADTTLSVKRRGVELANNDDIYAGDQLLITVTGGTVTVDGTAFPSGDIHVVTGNTAVVSTASA